jgi:hypothetical protein
MAKPESGAGPKLTALGFGQRGVTVDLNPLELGDNDLTQATNAIADPQSGRSTLRKRPGLVAFSTPTTAGTVLGGVDLPLADYSSASHFILIGRGPT